MRRLERLHAITHHLRARAPRVVSVTAMAERFEVSTRTIERDLRALHNAGIPLYAVDGRAGGYSILPDFTMQPVRLTAQEATVCLAALSMMRDSPYRRSATTASDKIAASLPAAVSDAINPHEIASIRDAGATSSIEWADARDDRRLVEIVYGDDPPRAWSSPIPRCGRGSIGIWSGGVEIARRYVDFAWIGSSPSWSATTTSSQFMQRRSPQTSVAGTRRHATARRAGRRARTRACPNDRECVTLSSCLRRLQPQW